MTQCIKKEKLIHTKHTEELNFLFYLWLQIFFIKIIKCLNKIIRIDKKILLKDLMYIF